MSTPRPQCKCHCTNCCTSTLPHCGIEPCNAEGVAAPLEPSQEFEDWKKSLPKCLGYEGGCDGDLEGLQHKKNCPMYGKEFATIKDAFFGGFSAAAAVSKNLREERDKLKAELDMVDEALARRPALAHIDYRYNKIFAACAGAAKSERLEKEIAALSKDGRWNAALDKAAEMLSRMQVIAGQPRATVEKAVMEIRKLKEIAALRETKL